MAQQRNDEMRRLSEASLAQNEEVKRISAWAAILFAPTLIGMIYGMNFEHSPADTPGSNMPQRSLGCSQT